MDETVEPLEINQSSDADSAQNGFHPSYDIELTSVSTNALEAEIELELPDELAGRSNKVPKPANTMPLEDVDAEYSSGEVDMIEVYTARLSTGHNNNKNNNRTVTTSQLVKAHDTRPDYSSTTNDSDDDNGEIPPGSKLLLQSDISHSQPRPIQHTKQLPFESIIGKNEYADPEIYMRCTHCIKAHTACNRRLPYCQRCSTSAECIYPKKGVYRNKERALEVLGCPGYPGKSKLSPKPPLEGSDSVIFKKPDNQATVASAKPQPTHSSVVIQWLDGDVSHSQKKCPSSVLKLIRDYPKEFNEVVSSTWGRSKGTFHDQGRKVVFMDDATKQEVPAARYLYNGRSHQFFVVWVPAAHPDDAPIPRVAKFKVSKGEPNLRYQNLEYRVVRWQTWAPLGASLKSRDILRLLEDKQGDPKSVPQNTPSMGSPDIVDTKGKVSITAGNKTKPGNERTKIELMNASDGDDSDTDVNNGTLSRRRSTRKAITYSLREDNKKRERDESVMSNHIMNDTREAKRARTASGRSWDTHPKLYRPQAPNGKFVKGDSLSSQIHGARLDTVHGSVAKKARPAAIVQPTKSIAGEPVKKGSDLTVVFQDRSGNINGTYPYDECDTAQKLFDVACVAQIAQIEPPATRLLKVQFEGGAGGKIRPDSTPDFENVFEANLKALRSVKGATSLKVTISPYL